MKYSKWTAVLLLAVGSMAQAAPIGVTDVVFTLVPQSGETNRLGFSVSGVYNTAITINVNGKTTVALSNRLAVDLTFDPDTNQVTNLSFDPSDPTNFIQMTSRTFQLANIFLLGAVTARLLGVQFQLGDLVPPLQEGPVLSPIAPNQFNVGGNDMVLNNGTVQVNAPLAGLILDQNLTTEPLDFEIPVSPVFTLTFTNATSLSTAPGVTNVTSTVDLPLTLVSVFLEDPSGTITATIVTRLVAVATYSVVIPEPSVFALCGIAGAIGAVSYRVHGKRKKAAKLDAVA